jgi:hypothetical protein
MLPPGKSLSPAISPGGGPLSQGFRKTPMASPLSPYNHGSSVLRSPVSTHGQSPGILPTILSPGRSTAGQSSPNSSQVGTHIYVTNRPVKCVLCCGFMFFLSFETSLEGDSFSTMLMSPA